MAAEDTDILTLAEGRAAVNLPGGTTQDDSLELYISGISGRIDELCGEVVQRSVTDERHGGADNKGRSKGRILLNRYYVTEVTSMSEWQDTTEQVLTEETDSTKPAEAFLLVIEPSDGPYSFVYRRKTGTDSSYWAGRRNLVVSYTAGRFADTASVSRRFKLACSSVLRRVFQREGSVWSQSPLLREDLDADGFGGQPKFFKAIDPMIREWLGDEMLPTYGTF